MEPASMVTFTEALLGSGESTTTPPTLLKVPLMVEIPIWRRENCAEEWLGSRYHVSVCAMARETVRLASPNKARSGSVAATVRFLAMNGFTLCFQLECMCAACAGQPKFPSSWGNYRIRGSSQHIVAMSGHPKSLLSGYCHSKPSR